MTAEERADLLNDIQTMLIEKGYPLYVGGYEDKGEIIDVILSVDAKPVRHGKWIKENKYGIWKCSECGCKVNRINPIKGNVWNYYYCPNCGAKMDGTERKYDEID